MVDDERRVALLAAFERSRAELLAAIEGLDELAMSEAALDGWSVKDHLNHVVHMDELRFLDIERVSRGYRVANVGMTLLQEDQLNAIGVELRRAMPLAQVLWELEVSRARVREAIQNATQRGLDEAHYGDVSLDGGVRHEADHARAIREWRQSRAG